MAHQKFLNFIQQGYPFGKNRCTKFFKTITKNMFNGTLILAESESGVRKIFKNFWKKLWAKNFFRPKLYRSITSQDSSGPPTCYIFFWHLGDALQDRTFKSGFERKFKKSTIWVSLPDLYLPNIKSQTQVSNNFFVPNTCAYKYYNFTRKIQII